MIPAIIAGADLLHGHLVTCLTAVTYHSPLPGLIRCGDQSAVTIPRLQVEELSLGSSVRVRNARDVIIIIAAKLADDDESDGGYDEENLTRGLYSDMIFCRTVKMKQFNETHE